MEVGLWFYREAHTELDSRAKLNIDTEDGCLEKKLIYPIHVESQVVLNPNYLFIVLLQ